MLSFSHSKINFHDTLMRTQSSALKLLTASTDGSESRVYTLSAMSTSHSFQGPHLSN
ncbi:hypothetical protein PISMIDRAFT_681469 [Pisolithus microcarpus 441]|uniref:Uncharacterized protein n=1 Tax=Pisolithus microcarpus 441 TaxID=765257 RepID=A0A0C9Z4Z0_9AGAM|nr:hypothetical protein PISMIDRAFT_681469 [Pisolithus microcarpus 441]